MIAIFFIFIFSMLGLGALGFWIYALIDIVKDELKNDTDKLIWFLLVFFLPFLGTILYFFVGRNKPSMPKEEYV